MQRLSSVRPASQPPLTMYISQETPTQTQARLRKVIAEAELLVYDQPYVFEEVSVERFPSQHIADALAFVRDSDVWSALVPQRQQQEEEAFSVFSFHFAPNLDNSGFVGWLASHLKASVGTGVFVGNAAVGVIVGGTPVGVRVGSGVWLGIWVLVGCGVLVGPGVNVAAGVFVGGMYMTWKMFNSVGARRG